MKSLKLSNSNHLVKILNKYAPMKVLSEEEAKIKLTPWITEGNKDHKKVKEWLDTIELYLNIDKTVFMIFTTPQKKRIQKVIVKLRENEIKEVHETKHLGVTLGNKLTWKSHIETFTNILYKVKHLTSKFMLRNCFV